jgi:excisionase family DNA binding protein
MIPGYMTISEAADALNVSEGRIRQLVLNGKLASQKVGPTLIPVESVAARKQAIKRPKKSNGNGHK